MAKYKMFSPLWECYQDGIHDRNRGRGDVNPFTDADQRQAYEDGVVAAEYAEYRESKAKAYADDGYASY